MEYIYIHTNRYVCIYAYTINKASQPSPSGNFSSIYCSGGGFSSLTSHLLMKSPKPSSFLPPTTKGYSHGHALRDFASCGWISIVCQDGEIFYLPRLLVTEA